MPEDRYEPWAEERRAELRGLYLSLLVELAGLYEERKEFEPAIEALGRVVAEEPTHEGAHVGLMRLYALSGRRREALSQYDRLRGVLFRELGARPEAAAVRLHDEIWAGSFPPADSSLGAVAQPEEERPFPVGAARHNLPLARTSFVGREREVLEVKRLAAMTRLLTLTGAAGCGKTRLALKVARDLAGAYPEGAWLVELAPLSEPELVPQAVAGALRVREQPSRSLVETLVDTLGARRMLLVLDNCEHLVGAVVGLVDELLGACPGLRVLATSRETLNAAGEVNWVAPSLTVPDPRYEEARTPQELEGYDSVRLFVERARQRDPSFALTPRNGQAVAQICWRLDGIPLAIEFATARVGVLSAEQIASKLDDSLGLLTAGERSAVPRHRTLRATLDWSHELLSEPERKLFRRLSIFAGGFALEAAEAVGAEEEGIEAGEVLDLLGRLVHKSLVVAEEAGEEDALRYRMLEFVRQYGRERLEESGEADAVRSRHAAVFLDLAERADSELRGPRQVAWLKRLSREQDNLRTAMAWLLGRSEFEEVVRLGWALWLFWWMHGHFAEGRRWMEEALVKGDAMPASSRVRALFVAGTMADGQGDRRSAEPLLEESLSLARKLGDKMGAAGALGSGGLVAAGQGQHERGIALLQESADLWLEIGDRWYASMVLNFLAVAWFGQGDHERAKRLAERGLALAREVGDAESTYVACHTGAMLAQAERDHERARGLLREGLKLAAEAGEETNAAYCLEELAALAASEGKVARAARLWGAAEALLEKIEAAAYIYAPDRSIYRSQVSAARAQLDEAAWQAAWARGRSMTPERAIAYALLEEEEREPPTPVPALVQQPPPTDERTERLTRREREVALLIGGGMTNRQIAFELSISERTVEHHVRKILKKLGFPSRSRIAAWVAQR